ncbi:hypothetical protein BGX26_001997 [Mortierella sp. AD094]|nr:hypothetical protein BGX26_001997 [Mortierella sp. AD094]
MSVIIIARHTGLTFNARIIATPERSDILHVSMNLDNVMTDNGFDFDLILSTREKLFISCTPSQQYLADAYYLSVMTTLMSDITTTDMIFTFPTTAEGRYIGLYAHQAVLLKQEKLSALLSKVAEVNVSCGIEGSEKEYSLPVKMLHIPNFSLEVFCCLIRFLYTGVIDLEVKPDQFAITEVEARQLLPVFQKGPCAIKIATPPYENGQLGRVL